MAKPIRVLGVGVLMLGIGLAAGCSTSATPTNGPSSNSGRAAAGTESPTPTSTPTAAGPAPHLTVQNNTGQPLNYQTMVVNQAPRVGTLQPGERSPVFVGFAGTGPMNVVGIELRNPNWTEPAAGKKTPFYKLPRIMVGIAPLNTNQALVADIEGLVDYLGRLRFQEILGKVSFPKPAVRPGDTLTIPGPGDEGYHGVNGTLKFEGGDETQETWSLTLNPYTAS